MAQVHECGAPSVSCKFMGSIARQNESCDPANPMLLQRHLLNRATCNRVGAFPMRVTGNQTIQGLLQLLWPGLLMLLRVVCEGRGVGRHWACLVYCLVLRSKSLRAAWVDCGEKPFPVALLESSGRTCPFTPLSLTTVFLGFSGLQPFTRPKMWIAKLAQWLKRNTFTRQTEETEASQTETQDRSRLLTL